MVLRAVRKALFIISSLLVLFIGLWHALAWKMIDEAKQRADLVVSGRMTDAKNGRADAVEITPLEAWIYVQFEVDSVRKGTWEHPDLGVMVHTRSYFYPHTEPGDRHLLFFERRKRRDGKTFLALTEERACVPILWPCGS